MAHLMMPPQKRHYKNPDDTKIPVTVNMTEVQREAFKRACKLAGLHQGEFVAKAAQEFITMWELRGAERGL